MLICHFVRLLENETVFFFFQKIVFQLLIHPEFLSFLSPSNERIVFLRFHDVYDSIFMGCLELPLSKIQYALLNTFPTIGITPKIRRVSLWLSPQSSWFKSIHQRVLHKHLPKKKKLNRYSNYSFA